AFHNLNIPEIKIKINNRKILAGLAAACGASDLLIDLTVAIDKLDKIGLDGVINELAARGFQQEQIAFIETFLQIKGNNEAKLAAIKALMPENELTQLGINELDTVLQLHQYFIKNEWTSEIQIDFTLASGLNYYTGIIVEVVTTAVEMGSIGGGGRYDDLTGLFNLKGVSGVGISFGIDRIFDVMEQLTLFPSNTKQQNILVLNIYEPAFTNILNVVTTLRENGIAAELYPDCTKLDKQLYYA